MIEFFHQSKLIMDNFSRISNEEFATAFRKRTKLFALSAIRFSQQLERSEEANILRRQFLRSATSVAANYRAACRARSSAEFHAKLCIVVEEADETLFWLELLSESGIAPEDKTTPLIQEATEILSVTAKARKNIKK